MKEVRIGLVGLGFMGRTHSNAWLKVGKFFKLDATPVMQGVCGRLPTSRLQEFSANWGWKSTETDYRKFVAREDIDIVDIVTPNNVHCKIAVAAAKAGKHIICEKPLAMNVAECKEMIAAVKKAGVKHMVFHNYRRCPAIGLARQIIEEGRLGRLFHIRACYLQDWIIDPKFPLVWRLQKQISGSGAHGDLNAHIIDLARYLVGEFSEVCGMTETFIKERPLVAAIDGKLGAAAGKGTGKVTVDDACLFLARFENGVIGTFEATRFAQGRKNQNKLEINGEKGTICFNFERMNELEYFSQDDPPHLRGFRTILATEPAHHPYIKAWWPPGHLIGYEHTFVHGAADFLQAVVNNGTIKPDFEDGLRNQEVLDAVLESAAKKTWVKVKKNKV